MWFTRITFVITLRIMCIENRMLPVKFMAAVAASSAEDSEATIEQASGDNSNDRSEQDDYSYEIEKKRLNDESKKACTIFVLSNIQHPSVQSLFRKYRYNSNGMLIPNSVKYFIKLPHGLRTSPLLIPLNDKAFSTLGGFVRFYKEVPPIPQSW